MNSKPKEKKLFPQFLLSKQFRQENTFVLLTFDNSKGLKRSKIVSKEPQHFVINNMHTILILSKLDKTDSKYSVSQMNTNITLVMSIISTANQMCQKS